MVLGTDGKIKAGAGNIVLSAAGLEIAAPAEYASTSAIRFVSGGYTASRVWGGVSALQTSVSAELSSNAGDFSGYNARTWVAAISPASGGGAEIHIKASYGTQSAEITITSDSVGPHMTFEGKARFTNAVTMGDISWTPTKDGQLGIQRSIGVGISYTPGDGDICAARYIRGEKGVVVGDGGGEREGNDERRTTNDEFRVALTTYFVINTL